ncbi:sigma 54-interacting transcriptional regulator [Desulfobacterales bacterium HSG17]|nr:sigma 54-interacting transcriptional regulator [Desulfobacterales bacterium HSG17]
MDKKPTYEELQKKLTRLEFQLNRQKESRQDFDIEKYYLDQAQEIAKLSTWEYDVKTETIFWTPQNYKTFGVPEGTKITSELVMEMVHPNDRVAIMNSWQETLSGKSYDIEHRILVNRKVKWIRNKAKIIHNNKGDVVRLIGITQDISYRINTKKMLEDAKRKTEENRFLKRELYRLSGDKIIGAEFGLKDIMEKATMASSVESPVLLLGETGVGKDIIANYIHYASSRQKESFITVNCGAIPDELIDSELFGHEKGAFTGAISQKQGRFERADKGTIFLDEIGELPLPAQVRLLRVLQNMEIERVGGTKIIPLDIRIIAATNRNLEEMVKNKMFREDLWFRLNVFPLLIPPLRLRIEDIPALTQHFIERKKKELKLSDEPSLAIGAIDTLMAYDWPGNVRELENVIERAIILHRNNPLRFNDLGLSTVEAVSVTSAPAKSENLKLDELIKTHIKHVLKLTNGKIHGPGGAGEVLKVNPDTLRYRMRKLGIPFRKEIEKKDT